MAAQAVLILIDGGRQHVIPSLALMPAMSFCEMRISGGGGNDATGSDPCAVVAVHAGRMTVVVEQVLGGIVRIGRRRETDARPWARRTRQTRWRMAHRRDVRAAVVAGNAILLILAAQQSRRPAGVMRRMAGNAGVLRPPWRSFPGAPGAKFCSSTGHARWWTNRPAD